MPMQQPSPPAAPRLLLIGAGDRGAQVYGKWIKAHPGRARLVGAAEPRETRRAALAAAHALAPAALFRDWRGLLAAAPPAEACIVATQDGEHAEPALAALEAGYDVLLEKPMATRADDCMRLVSAAERLGRRLRVCHVLRYTEFFRAAKMAVESGALGRVIHLAQSENVSYWHFAHSYVRGNWGNEGRSSPLVLAKTCHDLDILHWLAGGRAERVQSFGSLSHFRAENAPPGAPERCIGSASGTCPQAATCLWFAPRLYRRGEAVLGAALRARNPLWRLAARTAIGGGRLLEGTGSVLPSLAALGQWRAWPATVIAEDPSPAAVEEALRRGPYGRCVYRCDNDAPDHQTVAIEFEGGLTATMTVEGLSDAEGRSLRVEGSEATLVGEFGFAGERLELREHRSGRTRVLRRRGFSFVGHGGGDAGLMEAFTAELAGGEEAESSARASLESHLLAFAADLSRREGSVVRMEELRG